MHMPDSAIVNLMNWRPQIDVLRLPALKRELASEAACAVFCDSFHSSLHVVRLQKGSADSADKAIGGASPVLSSCSDQALGRLKRSCMTRGELLREFRGFVV